MRKLFSVLFTLLLLSQIAFAGSSVVRRPIWGSACGAKFQEESATSTYDVPIENYSYRGVSATKFKAVKTTNICQAGVMLRKIGTPTSDITVRICSHNSGADTPDCTTPLGSTEVLSESSLTGSYLYYNFSFTAPVAITLDTYYWLLVEIPYTSSSNYAQWGAYGSGVTERIMYSSVAKSSWTLISSTYTCIYRLYE